MFGVQACLYNDMQRLLWILALVTLPPCGRSQSCPDMINPGFNLDRSGTGSSLPKLANVSCPALARQGGCTDVTYGDTISWRCPATCGLDTSIYGCWVNDSNQVLVGETDDDKWTTGRIIILIVGVILICGICWVGVFLKRTRRKRPRAARLSAYDSRKYASHIRPMSGRDTDEVVTNELLQLDGPNPQFLTPKQQTESPELADRFDRLRQESRRQRLPSVVKKDLAVARHLTNQERLVMYKLTLFAEDLRWLEQDLPLGPMVRENTATRRYATNAEEAISEHITPPGEDISNELISLEGVKIEFMQSDALEGWPANRFWEELINGNGNSDQMTVVEFVQSLMKYRKKCEVDGIDGSNKLESVVELEIEDPEIQEQEEAQQAADKSEAPDFNKDVPEPIMLSDIKDRARSFGSRSSLTALTFVDPTSEGSSPTKNALPAEMTDKNDNDSNSSEKETNIDEFEAVANLLKSELNNISDRKDQTPAVDDAPIVVVLTKDRGSFGVRFRQRKGNGLLINGTKPDTSAARSQLVDLVGHRLLYVNGESAVDDTRETLAMKLKSSGDVLILSVASKINEDDMVPNDVTTPSTGKKLEDTSNEDSSST